MSGSRRTILSVPDIRSVGSPPTPPDSYTRPESRAPTPLSCREVRQRGRCYQEPYVPYEDTGLTGFRQSIMNAIARKNFSDKLKNTIFVRSLTRSTPEKGDADGKREADIRGVLKNIAYSDKSLKDYVLSSLPDAASSTGRSVAHSIFEAARRLTGYITKDGTVDETTLKTTSGESLKSLVRNACLANELDTRELFPLINGAVDEENRQLYRAIINGRTKKGGRRTRRKKTKAKRTRKYR